MTAKNEMPEHGKSRASVQDLAGDLATLIRHAGKRKVQDASPFVPEQTIANVKEDIEWARRRAKQSRT